MRDLLPRKSYWKCLIRIWSCMFAKQKWLDQVAKQTHKSLYDAWTGYSSQNYKNTLWKFWKLMAIAFFVFCFFKQNFHPSCITFNNLVFLISLFFPSNFHLSCITFLYLFLFLCFIFVPIKFYLSCITFNIFLFFFRKNFHLSCPTFNILVIYFWCFLFLCFFCSD